MKVSKIICIILLSGISHVEMSAQYLYQKSFVLSAGVNNYNGPFVRNINNGNRRSSFSGALDFQNKISELFSYRFGIGAGHMRNMEDVFPTETSSDFFRFSGGLILNGNSGFFQIPKTPTKFQPYFHIGYHFDYISRNPEVGYTKMLGTLNLGAGAFIRINDYIGLSYRYSLNQRLGQDYRTFHLHEFGLIFPILKMKQEKKPVEDEEEMEDVKVPEKEE